MVHDVDMGMFDYVKCDYPLPISEEIKNDLPEQEWSDISFQTKSLDCSLETHVIEDDGQIYVERIDRYIDEKGALQENKTGIEKLEWTGELLFYFDFFKENEDIWIEFKALIWKGELKDIELLHYKKVDNSDRIKIQKELEEKIKQSENKPKNWWWKPLKVWCWVIRVPLFMIRWVLGCIVRFSWKLERWLTGGTLRF